MMFQASNIAVEMSLLDRPQDCPYLTTPGATQLTLILSAAVSVARALVRPSRAVLLTE